MSVINQMLRELDARGNASSNASVAMAPAPGLPRRPRKLAAMGLLMLMLVAGLGYWILSSPAKRHASVQPVPLLPRLPESQSAAPRVVLPSTGHSSPSSPSSLTHAAKRETTGNSGLADIPLIQMATSLSVSPLQRPAIATSTVASPLKRPIQEQTEPDSSINSPVVKKTVDLSPEAEAQQLFDDAQALRHAGQAEAAIGKYQQALVRDPAMRSARLQLAGLLQEAGRSDKALQVLTGGYEQQPDDALAIAAGRMLADRGQREEALNWLQRGYSGLRPADIALMGALLSQLQRYEESANAYQRALAADPGQGGWLLGLGLALEALGRMDEARAAYRKALERGDFKPDVIDFLLKKTA